MATRPTVPSFFPQDSSMTSLQNLSSSVAFIATTEMGWHVALSADQGPLTAGANTQISFGTAFFDPDGVLFSGAARVQTRGYYDVEATLPFSNTATGAQTCAGFFKLVTGANNPLGSGVSIQFGTLSDLTTSDTDEMSITFYATSPCLYPLDQVQVWLKVTGTGVTVSHTWNNSGNLDLGGFADGGAYFTGAWVSEGP